MEYYYGVDSSGNLYHWGIKGMKWGVRRFQNKDGSLTPAGKKRKAELADSRDENKDGSLTPAGKKRYAIARDGTVYKSTVDYFNDVARRETRRMEKLSGRNDYSGEDHATFVWDVEAAMEYLHGDKTGERRKAMSSEVRKWMANDLETAKAEGFYEFTKKYQDTYMRDVEAYTKALLDTLDDYSDPVIDELQGIKHSINGSDDELYHWGIKGMKWGQRRYQNKDGSLTPAGKKRYAQEEAALKEREKTIKNREREAARRAKMDAKKADLDAREAALNGGGRKKTEAPTAPKKTINDLSIDELRELTTRMNVERDFYNARANLAAANPKQVSRGKKFVNSLMNDVIAPAAVSAGKDWANKKMKSVLGLDEKKTKTAYDKLNDKWKKVELEKKIAEAERDIAKAKKTPKETPSLEELVDRWSSLDADERKKYEDAAKIAGDAKKITEVFRSEEKKK